MRENIHLLIPLRRHSLKQILLGLENFSERNQERKKIIIYRKYVVPKLMGCLSNLNWIIKSFEDLHFSVPV